MNKQIAYWQIVGFIFTSIMGTFLHFLFDLSGGSTWASLISATNESIWEHMKLLFYPMVFFTVVEYFSWGKEYPAFGTVKLLGALLGLILIPVIYYTYTGITGVNVDWFNIAIFFLVAGIVFYGETKLLTKPLSFTLPSPLVAAGFILIALAFTICTFSPPDIPLFQPPK